jgi:eukaryotic-like serine/threonine-protein kinase
MDQCPTPQQLARWLLQAGQGADDHDLADHVDTCRHCQHLLEGLTSGAALRPTRAPLPPTDAIALGQLKAGPSHVEKSLVPRDQPATVPARLAGGSHTGPRMEQETRDLLQRRLRVFSLVSVVVFLGGASVYLGASPSVHLRYIDQPGGAGVFLALLASLVCAVIVWGRPVLRLPALRRTELVLFGLAAAVFAKHRFTALTHGPEGPWEGPGHREMFVIQVTMINNALWNFLIVCYGVFIPNTWRRCVVIVASLALVPMVFTILAALEQPAVRERLGLLVGFTAMGLLVSTALAVFGSFKISTLQQEALAARQLGQYHLQRLLGAGGMGEVYLAEHRLLKRPCAIKLIRPEQASDPQLLQRFEREVRATALLSHPNTVEVYDYGHTDDGTFYYVMEYLPGLSLDELVRRHGPQPAARVVHYLRQLCGALHEAHQAGLVHRDIKPSNIIACNLGGLCDVVKLVDFGLVRPPAAAEEGRLTKEGLILGTPDFMSPEQARGEDALDARSDLYSLGSVAYFLLTGQPPFTGRSVLATLTAHLHEPPAPPSSRGAAVDADVEAVVLRCLAKSPAERFGDAGELEQALEACRCAGQWSETQARHWWQGRPEQEAGG